MLLHLSMYAAFLIASEDHQFRNAFDFLHLLKNTIEHVLTEHRKIGMHGGRIGTDEFE